MIKVFIENIIDKKQTIYKKIIVKGHSIKKGTETEVLCAVVSTVVLGTVNTLLKMQLVNSELVIEKASGYFSFYDRQPNRLKQTILIQMITQLETVKQYFQKGIKIIKQNDDKK